MVSTEWHTIIAWDRQAEIAEKPVQKGKEVAISGRITQRSYDDSEG
jgi:single-strand DNA-binding protein